MKLLFKQRLFSWFDSYDIYDEAGNIVYTIKGQLAWGHCLKIYDAFGHELGTVQEKVFSFLPRFEIYINDRYVGNINKEFSFFKPRFNIDYNGWQVEGDFFEWDYSICDSAGRCVLEIFATFNVSVEPVSILIPCVPALLIVRLDSATVELL